MTLPLSDIIKKFENEIPLSLQEKWDKSGLQTGTRTQKISKVLFALDVCHEVIKEAVRQKANLIVCHHPLKLGGWNTLDLDTYEGQIVRQAILNDIAIYCSHTNHDSSQYSLNRHYAKKIGLSDLQTIRPIETPPYYKLVVFVPVEHTDRVLKAIFQAGGGGIGNYSSCSFRSGGLGTFKGDDKTNPFIGKPGILEVVEENRVEVLVERTRINEVVYHMIKAHPYEEVAYDIIESRNTFSDLGLGVMGKLEKPKKLKNIVPELKKIFKVKNLKVAGDLNREIATVGLCTGSGSSLLPDVVKKGIDLFITGDIKYHTAVDVRRMDFCVIDPGHFYSEISSVSLLKTLFAEWFGGKLALSEYKKLKDPFVIV